MESSAPAEVLAAVMDAKMTPKFELLHRIFAAALLLDHQQQQQQTKAPPQLSSSPMHIAHDAFARALLRWGDDPAAAAAIVSAYAAAALRVTPACARVNDGAGGDGDSGSGASSSGAAFLDAALAEADRAVGTFGGLAASTAVLDAAAEALSAASPVAALAESAAQHPSSAAAAAPGVPGSGGLEMLRCFWFDPRRGLRLAAIAQALLQCGAPATAGVLVPALVKAVESAFAAEALPSCSSAAAAAATGAKAGSKTAADLQHEVHPFELACALLVHDCWDELCACIGAAPYASSNSSNSSSTARAERCGSAAVAAAACGGLGSELAALFGRAPRLLAYHAAAHAPALAAACWAQPALQRGVVAALSGSAHDEAFARALRRFVSALAFLEC